MALYLLYKIESEMVSFSLADDMATSPVLVAEQNALKPSKCMASATTNKNQAKNEGVGQLEP